MKTSLVCEACRGCRTLKDGTKTPDPRLVVDIIKCIYVYSDTDLDAIPNCPCQLCLVKTMCYSVCDEFIKTRNELGDLNRPTWTLKKSGLNVILVENGKEYKIRE